MLSDWFIFYAILKCDKT